MNASERESRRRDKIEMLKLRFSRRPKYWIRIPSTFKLLALIVFLSFYYTDDIYRPKVAKHIHKTKAYIIKGAKAVATVFIISAGGGR